MILPGATIGIVGGGQLGKMIAQEAVSMGYRTVVLDPTPGCPASLVADQIVAQYEDERAVSKLAQLCDVVTYEFENVDGDALRRAVGAELLPQGVRALEICQDRAKEKEFLSAIEVPVAPYRTVDTAAELDVAVSQLGYPCVLKTSRGGYDGKGQVVLHGVEDLMEAQQLAETHACVLEQWVPFEKEISVIVAGNGSGNFHAFPASENEHRNNILYRSTVPAQVSKDVLKEAERIAKVVATHLDLRGAMGVEMFVLRDGRILVNELAPRPHNSGHYTIEACDYSQFAAHVRGICGLPLSDPELLSAATMTNILGEDMEEALSRIREDGNLFFHFYGKAESKLGRKMGHITTLKKGGE